MKSKVNSRLKILL